MADDLTACGPWQVERIWHKHHGRISDRWEWVIEDDAGVIAYLPEDDDNTEVVARAMASVPDLLDRIEALEAERDASDAIAREVSKVYDNLTSGAVSYPDTLADAVVAEHDERCCFRAERDAALADAAKLREVANRVNRAWLRGDIDGPDGEGPAALLALHRAADTEEAKSDAD